MPVNIPANIHIFLGTARRVLFDLRHWRERLICAGRVDPSSMGALWVAVS
jgi:hypothetical protein